VPKIDLAAAPRSKGSAYPPPFATPCQGREVARLATAAGLTQFGVVLVTLKPGAWSSQRHWHMKEDELAYVLSGEVVLIEDEGETRLAPGDCAAWKAGVANGHHLINRGPVDAVLLVVGTRDNADWGEYSDIDMRFNAGRYERQPGAGGAFSHKDGTPY
jgi:uncharacterized cupin superfamily protein